MIFSPIIPFAFCYYYTLLLQYIYESCSLFISRNAAGRPCMFPFMYKNQWYSSCTDSEKGRLWCAVETKYDNETWGYCPTNGE
uniref:Fibronectin type-II domain-containing protein n=1 Tax=Fundulus heteroclitus TaxID=8078 RepID=A0A3Q2NVC2_FUNHE